MSISFNRFIDAILVPWSSKMADFPIKGDGVG